MRTVRLISAIVLGAGLACAAVPAAHAGGWNGSGHQGGGWHGAPVQGGWHGASHGGWNNGWHGGWNNGWYGAPTPAQVFGMTALGAFVGSVLAAPAYSGPPVYAGPPIVYAPPPAYYAAPPAYYVYPVR